MALSGSFPSPPSFSLFRGIRVLVIDEAYSPVLLFFLLLFSFHSTFLFSSPLACPSRSFYNSLPSFVITYKQE